MTEEQKQILIKDLCGRLPYGVKAKCTEFSAYTFKVEGVHVHCEDFPIVDLLHGQDIVCMPIMYVKPYLFPLSSMTKAQKEEYLKTGARAEMCGLKDVFIPCLETFDWLNAHHFDYCGLIEQGLAIDATDMDIY